MKNINLKIITLLFLLGGIVCQSAKGATGNETEVSVKQILEEMDRIKRVIQELKRPDFFLDKLETASKSNNLSERSEKQREVQNMVLPVIQLQAELEWLNLQSVRKVMEDLKKQKEVDMVIVNQKYAELERLYNKGFSGIYSNEEEAIKEARKALDLKKEILLQSPEVCIDKLLTVRYELGDGATHAMGQQLGVPPVNWATQLNVPVNGYKTTIQEISGLKNGTVSSRTLFKPEVEGSSLADLTLHWDGDRIMFTMLNSERKWQLYEMNVDGTNVKQVVDCEDSDLEFFDPAYLPDGRIIAVSNIGYQGVPCNNGIERVGNMVLYDPKNKSMRRLTFDQDANWNPIVKNNGKVMYTRWEYTDLMHYYSRFVMHMNPDGTEQKAIYGSGSLFPNSTFDVKPLPGNSNHFVGVICGHHGIARSGRLIIFDPSKGTKAEKGMVQELPFSDREIIPIEKDYLVDGVWPQFLKPYPLTDKTFLVTAKLSPNSLWGVYLVDVHDNLTLLHNADKSGMIYSVPVKTLQKPMAIPDRVKLNEKEATVFIQDIYEGEGLPGVPRGEVKKLRIFAYEYAYPYSPSDHMAQGIQSGWDIKRLIGTVPVEEDGSAIFKIPANTPISLQPLDSQGRAIQWMRSWLTGMPGEIVSCIGCHEDQRSVPIPKRVIASGRQPHSIDIAEGGPRSYTFINEVQPILDRACVSCHDGSRKDMPNFKDTTSVPVRWQSGKFPFNKSYLAFHPYVSRQGPEADMFVMTPYEYHASTSEVVSMLEKGHYNVKLTDKEWDHLYTWIDFNAPCIGGFQVNIRNGIDPYQQRIHHTNKYANGAGVDWREELKEYAGYLKKQGTIAPEMPSPVEKKKQKEPNLKQWPISSEEIKSILSTVAVSKKEIEISDGVKIMFVRIPAGKFIMGSKEGSDDENPLFVTEVKKDFWMSERELTNKQYNALVPEHDSRIYAQFWKDHTIPGYPANLPEQPVVRVSYEEAIDYCQKLSERVGYKVTIPTETQWEWACRAGSDKPFWFGDLNADFGPYENLADVQLEKLVVFGVDPRPENKANPHFSHLFEYYNYTPKIETIDDGQMLPSESDCYKANPFGLKNMHGTLAEWTRSVYQPYPYHNDPEVDQTKKVVVRGGSWIDRPKNATASIRKSYLPWQKVNNVGIRLIIEE